MYKHVKVLKSVGNFGKDMWKDSVKEFKAVKRVTKRKIKNTPKTLSKAFWNYPITTGAAAGVTLGLTTGDKKLRYGSKKNRKV
jgi:hypothetical protein